jgi:PTS system nitrogen regulatory IIA component
VQLTVRDAAKLLGVTERQLYGFIDGGEIPFFRINDQYRFNQTELLEWAMTRRLSLSNAFFATEESARLPGPRLARALGAGGVFHDVPGSDRDSVLREVVARIPLATDEDRELIFGILIAREACGSTGVGDGIAIPHVRSPVVSGTSSGSITLCTLRQPVQFGAADQQPVHTLFSIVSPTIETHLQLLGRLATALHDAGFRDAVLGRALFPEIISQAERLDRAAAAEAESRPP